MCNSKSANEISQNPTRWSLLLRRQNYCVKTWTTQRQNEGNRCPKTPPLGNLLDTGEVYFEDYDTHCNGFVLDNETILCGFAKQLKRGEPGFFVATRGIEHEFTLKRTEDSVFDQISDLHSKLHQLRSARALTFAAWCGPASSSTVSGEKLQGHQIDWAEVEEDMLWLCDEVGNTMRRYVLLLDNVSFDNPVQRKECLEDLGNKGICRAKVHEVWDATILLPR